MRDIKAHRRRVISKLFKMMFIVIVSTVLALAQGIVLPQRCEDYNVHPDSNFNFLGFENQPRWYIQFHYNDEIQTSDSKCSYIDSVPVNSSFTYLHEYVFFANGSSFLLNSSAENTDTPGVTIMTTSYYDSTQQPQLTFIHYTPDLAIAWVCFNAIGAQGSGQGMWALTPTRETQYDYNYVNSRLAAQGLPSGTDYVFQDNQHDC